MASTNFLTTQAPTHAKRVLSLYKRSLRCIRDHYPEIHDYHYHAAIVRKMFDDKKHIKDFVEADKEYKFAEIRLKSYMADFPYRFFNSPGGTAYDRYTHYPDWVLDTWHPIEKAQYPEYFAKREIRKREFLENWDKTYREPEGSSV